MEDGGESLHPPLESLVEKSLLRQDEHDGERRFLMLGTIREYGLERLEAHGEASSHHFGHTNFFLRLAEEAEPKLTGPQQGEWMDRLDRDHASLREEIRWSLDARETEVGAMLAGLLWRFWAKRGHLTEGRYWLERALGAGDGAASAARARVCRGAGNLARRQSDFVAACRFHEESLAIHRALGDQSGVAGDLNNLGTVAILQGDHARARSLHEESLAIYRQLGDRWAIAVTLNNMGVEAEDQADYDVARSLYAESLAMYRDLGDKQGIALTLTNLGIVATFQENYDLARSLCEESLPIHKEVGERRGMALPLQSLGTAALYQGDLALALACCEESLAIYQEVGDRRGLAESLELLAAIAVARGQMEPAARVLGSVEALRESIGAPLSPGRRAAHE